ncbi:23S rRNA (pseudouridine(1915)-N(3))-methyltransferase RlmH [Marinicella rhabdoformis]|uniref:23S rRNA (pseudouridine(1915)-N(3))-methyltransferase RlmH n=1 Tax=Marinicella rhabdoformis TaxID=2580566 RepID=UPI0012AEDCB5|nr:23S rRNA (pseudouridine(1915)-N(3))-methyltransferase RlmH [Marinicella rhabdoformis]
MKLRLLTLGHKMPDWVGEGFELYNQRLPHHLKVNLVEINAVVRQKTQSTAQIKAIEAEAIQKQLQPGDYNIALDEAGQLISTKGVAQAMADWQMMGQNINIIIGGADGLDHSIKQVVDKTWSLSRLTFPHQLVRVVIAEQIYRAHSLLTNHPYHRE